MVNYQDLALNLGCFSSNDTENMSEFCQKYNKFNEKLKMALEKEGMHYRNEKSEEEEKDSKELNDCLEHRRNGKFDNIYMFNKPEYYNKSISLF